MARPAALGVGADRDPGHGHDRLDVGLVHAVDDDRDVEAVVDEGVEREVGRVRVERRRRGRRASDRPIPGGSPRTRCGCRPSPGRRPRSPSRRCPRAISARTRSRTCGSASAATQSSTPRPWSAGGRIVARVVAAAVYGYWSAATSRPSARAASSRATASPARPQTARDPHLRCETWSRAAGPGRADRRDRFVERREQAIGLVAHVGRVQPAARGRRGDERLDLGRRRRASRARR